LGPGDLICGDYEVIALAGVGATSYVYQCRKRGVLGREFAVKVLHTELAAQPAARARFLREARFVLELNHENVISAHEIIDLPGLVAYVMDHVQGMCLRQWLKARQRLSDEELFGIFFDVMAGLEYVHARGVIHRDLKPGNILMDFSGPRPVARLIDFGVARWIEEGPSAEDFDAIRGTAGYMSPDEIRSPHEVCAASDLYSLGVIMYELACGRRPFTGRPPSEILKAHLHELPLSPGVHRPDLHPALEGIILRLLAKQPETRFASVHNLRMALVAALDLSAELDAVPAFVPDADDPEAQRQWLALVQALMSALLWVLLSPGATGRPDDPHYASRAPAPLPGLH
jgi:serine/threonine protein kinase